MQLLKIVVIWQLTDGIQYNGATVAFLGPTHSFLWVRFLVNYQLS